jgi:hypothetical protein
MSGFSCTPSIVPPPAPPASKPIVNDGWFPNIDPAKLREERRIREAVTADRLRAATLEAIIWTNDQLAEWRDAQAAASFEDVPSPPLAGETRNLVLYRTAVGAWTKALLVEHQRDTDLTGAGQRKVEELDESICELRRDALHAVRRILGRTRTCVDLI